MRLILAMRRKYTTLQTDFRALCLKISHQLLFQTDLLEQNNGEATVIITGYYQVLEMKNDFIVKRDQYGSRRNGCDGVNGNNVRYNGG